MIIGVRQRLLATTLLFGSVVVSSPVLAQNPSTDLPASQPAAPTSGATLGADPANSQPTAVAPPAPAENEPTDIIVTGTRISGVTNANNPSPISVATAAQIQLTKSTTVEEVLQKMIGPDANALSNASNNGGYGLSEISLRDLGPARTLVLVDGQRLIPNGSVPDINAIPISMIERIDVLRDGASSVYGADAIGGVVNLILKHKADGFHIDAGGGVTQHGGGSSYNIGATWGISNDHGSLVIGGSWDHKNAINGYQRKWANDPHIGTDSEGGTAYRSQLDALQATGTVVLKQDTLINGQLVTAGTAVGASGTTAGGFEGTLVATGGAFYTTGNPALANVLPNTLYLPNVGRVKLNANGSRATPWNTLQGSLDRKSIDVTANYDLFDNFTVFGDGFFNKRVSGQLLRPEPLLGSSIGNGTYPGFFIPANFPGNPTTGNYFANLIPVQFGPRTYRQNSETFRIRAGFRGSFGNNKFKWEVAGVEQQNDFTTTVGNTGNFLGLGQLFGQLPCINVPGGCNATTGLPNVTPNIYGGNPDAIFNADQLAFAKYTQTNQQHSYERYLYGNLSGSLFALPGGDAKFSLGGEYRGEGLRYTPDALVIAGFAPNQSFPTNGSYSVKSVYGELYLPVLKDVPGAYLLDVTPSGRYDKYSTFGTAKTYKVGANWAPVRDLRFRGSYGIGFRAPQVQELFGGTVISDNNSSGDPCDTAINGGSNFGQGVLTAGSTCSLAVAGGAAVTTFTDPGIDNSKNTQIQTLQGGNAGLKPEKSRGLTAGVVIEPRFMRGFSFAADYYWTKVKNQILPNGLTGSVGNDFILLNCYGTAQVAAYCARIHRAPDGTILLIDSLADNGGSQTVRGIDFEVTFDTKRAGIQLPFGGGLAIDAQVSKQLKDDVVNPDGSVTHYTGTFSYDNATVHPRWRGLISADYGSRNWGLHYDAQYSSKLRNYDGTDPVEGNRVRARWTHSASAWIGFRDVGPLTRGRLTFGVDNLFDKDPPFLDGDSTSKSNTLGGPYDPAGRTFFAKLSVDFLPRPASAPVAAPVAPPPPPPPASMVTCESGEMIAAPGVCPPAPPPPPPPPPPAKGERG